MTHPLVELSDTKNFTGCNLVVENYNLHPAICRSGIWIGWSCDFTETIVLAYEHDPEELYVGWAINGAVVIDPGYSAGTPPWGAPVPTAPSVTYVCPYGGLYHQISLASTAGHEQVCLWVQVLYRYPDEEGQPFHYGPSMYVCLDGYEVIWPEAKLAEMRACLLKFYELLMKYVEIAPVGPGDPVERWLAQLRGDDAVRVKGLVDTFGELDRETEGVFAGAIKDELAGLVRFARSPGAFRSPPPGRSGAERAANEEPPAED
jgi:hypothetical protein